MRGAGVEAVRRKDDGTFCLTTARGEYNACYVVNAAGVEAAAVSHLFGDNSFEIVPRKGEYLLFDHEVSDDMVKGIVFPVPNEMSKGILVCRTVAGNVFVGPNAMVLEDRLDTSVTAVGQAEIIAGGQRLMKNPLPLGKAITEFAGVRAAIRINAEIKEDFLIGWSKAVPGLYQVAGIQSPGLSAAPAIGEYVAKEIIKEFGMHSSGTVARRGGIVCDTHGGPLLEKNSNRGNVGISGIPMELFNRIICRCEKISEGEIIAAIRRPCGAVTVDGVKRRTRAGMGRCQGGFCVGRVAKILARELGVPLGAVRKDGVNSSIAIHKEKFGEYNSAKMSPSSLDGGYLMERTSVGHIPRFVETLTKEENASYFLDSGRYKSINIDDRLLSLAGEKCNWLNGIRSSIKQNPLCIDRRKVVIVGGGPAGLSAAYGAYQCGVRDILIVERDRETGGVLQQCIHTGFGLHRFNEELTGPGYAERCLDLLKDKAGIEIWNDSMVLEIGADKRLLVASPVRGRNIVKAEAIVLAMGCRERSRGAIRIPGTRPAGVMTAGTAQRLINLEGYLPGRKAVILGSGDIGLIMARRLTLAGCEVKGVFEICSYSNGLARNVHQCLEDFGIPLYLSHTVVDIKGKDRVTSVVIAKVDSAMKPISGTEFEVECDTLLLSVGLIPENELTREAGIEISPVTGGPIVNQYRETSVSGIFAAGNVVQVHDLVDFVSEEAELAGENAALKVQDRLITGETSINVKSGPGIRSCVPQRLRVPIVGTVKLYIRAAKNFKTVEVAASTGERGLIAKKLKAVRPSEMITLELPVEMLGDVNADIMVELKE